MTDPMDQNRILLVDDEQAITDNLAPLLERAGFAVSVAADGQKTEWGTARPWRRVSEGSEAGLPAKPSKPVRASK